MMDMLITADFNIRHIAGNRNGRAASRPIQMRRVREIPFVSCSNILQLRSELGILFKSRTLCFSISSFNEQLHSAAKISLAGSPSHLLTQRRVRHPLIARKTDSPHKWGLSVQGHEDSFVVDIVVSQGIHSMRTFQLSRIPFSLAALSLVLSAAHAQEDPHLEFSSAIEDNSFFVEEAYNQEAGVIQHILTANYLRADGGSVASSFTQEWPVFGQVDQFSVTIPYSLSRGAHASGIGDILLNYRYQLSGHDDVVTMAPRLSIVLPTGDASKGLGMNALGVQCNLPVSKRMSERFVAHANAGATLFPSAPVAAKTGPSTSSSGAFSRSSCCRST